MKVPLSWIKEYVDVTEDIQTLCDKMVGIGLEIEDVVYLGEKVTNVKVCRIVDIAQHPNAERLLCCKVDIGGEIIPIVTNDQGGRQGARCIAQRRSRKRNAHHKGQNARRRILGHVLRSGRAGYQRRYVPRS